MCTGRLDHDTSARSNPRNLVIQPVPSLAAILLSVEQKKGEPLTKPEVEALRDNITVVAVPAEAAEAVDINRGAKDIDASNVWEAWQVLRKPFQCVDCPLNNENGQSIKTGHPGRSVSQRVGEWDQPKSSGTKIFVSSRCTSNATCLPARSTSVRSSCADDKIGRASCRERV